ncbi:MAG: DUF1826 domain-containing protein [Pseudomonadota bacterium]
MSVAETKSFEGAIACGSDPAVLSRIAEPTITLAIWRRQLAADLKSAAAKISKRDVDLVTSLNPNSNDDRQRFTGEIGTLADGAGKALAHDLLDLAERYIKIIPGRTARIRFETVKDDGCRRFHLDNVAARLIVTYHGPGTQWVSPALASTARERQSDYAGPLNSIRAGDVAIFRGKKSGAADLILHRSPPLTPVEGARLVAVVDGVDA